MGPNVFQYLIYILTNAKCSTIVTFVNIFVNILDGLDRCAYFNVDVAVVPCGKIRIIWNYITIIAGVTMRIGVGPAIVGSSILWITILAQAGVRTEILWIVLAALSFDHARCIWEFGATWIMHLVTVA